MNASALAHAGGVDTASTAGWGVEQSRPHQRAAGQVIGASGKPVATATSTLLTFELPSPAQHSSTNGQHS
jgi:hypothetical protein